MFDAADQRLKSAAIDALPAFAFRTAVPSVKSVMDEAPYADTWVPLSSTLPPPSVTSWRSPEVAARDTVEPT